MRCLEMNYRLRVFLISKCNLDSILVDQYMGDVSPIFKNNGGQFRNYGRPNINIDSLEEFMWVFAFTVRACHNNVSENFPKDHQPIKTGDPLLPMDSFSYKMIFCESAVLTSILANTSYNLKANEVLVRHISWEDAKVTGLCFNCCKEFYQVQEYVRSYTTHVDQGFLMRLEKEVVIYNGLLGIEDSLAPWRISTALSMDTGFIYAIVVAKSPQKTIHMLGLLRKWVTTIPLVAGFILWSKEEFSGQINTLAKDQQGKLSTEFQTSIEFFSIFLKEEGAGFTVAPFPNSFKIPK